MGAVFRGRGRNVRRAGRGPCTYCGKPHRHVKNILKRWCCHGRSIRRAKYDR